MLDVRRMTGFGWCPRTNWRLVRRVLNCSATIDRALSSKTFCSLLWLISPIKVRSVCSAISDDDTIFRFNIFLSVKNEYGIKSPRINAPA